MAENPLAVGACPRHPGKPGITLCPRCGRYMCPVCVSQGVEVSGHLLCRDCLGHLAQDHTLRREVAWESRGKMPAWRAFLITWKDVILTPRAFFMGMEPEGGLARPFIFAAVCLAVGLVGSLMGVGEAGQMVMGAGGGFLLAVLIICLAPAAFIFGFAVSVLGLHVLARGFGGNGSLRATARATAYGQAAAVAEIIPVVGGILALVLRLSLYGWGVPSAHGFSTKRSLGYYFALVAVTGGTIYLVIQLFMPLLDVAKPAGL